MDLTLIYMRTASGEEAMRERSRIAQRNMRMMLTLIDENASLADLCAKTGNSQLAEEALRQLEEGGFIEPLAVQNSLMALSKDLEQEIKAVASEQTSEFSTFGDKYEAVPGLASLPQPQAGTLALARSEDGAQIFARTEEDAAASSSARSLLGKRAELLDRIKSLFRAAEASEKRPEVSIGAIRHGTGGATILWPIRWPIIAFLALVGLVVVAGLAFVFFPLNRYLPEVEAALAQASGQPAKVGEIYVNLYPKPGLFLSNVRLGSEIDGKAVRIAELRLLPEIGSLLESKKIARQMNLAGVVLPAEAVAGFSGFFDALAQPASPLGVRQIFFEKTNLDLRGLSLPGLVGMIKLSPDERFESLELHLPDRSLQIEVKPLSGGLDIALEGFGWRPSPDSAFLFDSLSVKGRLGAAGISINSMSLRIFDGLVQGLVRLRAGQQASMDGEITFERINAKRFGTAVGIVPQFEGEIRGAMQFLAAAGSWPTIFANMQAEGEFSLGRGSLGGLDLAEAARRLSSSPMHGGTTRFEQLQGKFKLTPENRYFSNLTLTSGLMQSVGQIAVSKDLELSGNMEVQMRGTVNQMQVPLLIGGSLAAPLLQIGKH